MSWKAIDRYSKDYIELQTKDKVKFYKTPDAVLKKTARGLGQGRRQEVAENALFKQMSSPSRKFAKRATHWSKGHRRQQQMAYDYYFGPRPSR